MDKAQLLVAMMGAGGGGAALLAFVTGMWKWISGASARERLRNTELSKQRQEAILARIEAEKSRDAADRKRRQAEEYASLLRRQLIDAGHEPVPPPNHAKENNDGNNR